MSHQNQSATAMLRKIFPYIVILLALLLQMSYFAELQEGFPGTFGKQPFCGVDAKAHVERASGLLDGSIPGPNTFYFIPFYPVYLAILKQVFGDSLFLPIWFQALFQLVGIAALYATGRLVYSPLTGSLAALGLATYNYYIFYLPCFDQSLWTVPFLTLAVFMLVKYSIRRQAGYMLGAGLAFALAAMSRPTILAVICAVIAWLFLYRVSFKEFSRNVVLLITPFLILVAPITWHNYKISGRFILLSDNLGVNLFTGNNPDAYGLDSLAHSQSQPAVLRYIETADLVKSGKTTLNAEVIRYITEQPGDWLALTATKTWLWFGESDEPLITPFFPLAVRQSTTLSSLPLAWQAMVTAAILGVLLVRGRSRRQISLLWLVYGTFSAATIFFFIQLRFRLPFAPFVLLAGASLPAAAHHWSYHQTGRYWLALVVLLGLFPFVPTLWIFILLFGVVGVGRYLFSKNQSGYRLAAWGVLFYFIIMGWWLRANALATDVAQPIDHYLGPPLAGVGVLGQTFQMDCDGLNRIDVTLGVLNTPHDEPVTFYLASDISGQEILFSETFAGNSVTDYQARRFSFEPIPDSAGRTFFFFITSPTSTPQNGITARGYTDTPVDGYPPGSAWAGQLGELQQFQADFAFRSYCDFTPWQKLGLVLE